MDCSHSVIFLERFFVRVDLLGMFFGRSWPAQMTAVWEAVEVMIQRCL